MPRRKDIWQCGLITRPLDEVLSRGFSPESAIWFPPEPAFTFLADPFGFDDGVHFHVFAEQYDYRTRHGVIERLSFDRAFSLVDRRLVLREPWHLSYPQVFEGEGAIWMLPEAHRSGKLTLYRGNAALDVWRAECAIELDCLPVDASILRHDGRWWLFYSSGESRETKLGTLHVAWAERLTGPWTPHPGNPVRRSRASARPGGVPVLVNGAIVLPTQDCTRTYGGAIRPLWIDQLDETAFEAREGDALAFPGQFEGMHTLSGWGDVTLFDVKTIDRSLAGIALDLRRGLGRYADR
ncbi:hypothetical protein EDF56_102556 [Novosphingobium sp. PhB165]|uniref:glucosamine inositolphosphorylceramide transferase family protein n=1 Tax=Novosphingobium sp. PhB165 TaxID=2485105 RepID=UPI0010E97FDC|nr:formyl transferase [Novosphingobium sp. PhB165]TCM20892.1 hypothetical protein EDF56_102556 [Novosphingobium sp. PhB165]